MFFRILRSSFATHRRLYSTRSTAGTRAYKRFGTVCATLSAVTVCAVTLGLPRFAYLDALSPSDFPTTATADPITTDPDTKITFPNKLFISSKVHHEPFKLLGVGVRRVSIFSVKVYSVGFYADLSNPSLQVSIRNSLPIDHIHITRYIRYLQMRVKTKK